MPKTPVADDNKESYNPRQTQDDKKVEAALQIRQQGCQLVDVLQVIVECARTLGDSSTSKRDKAKAIGHLRKVALVCSAMSTSWFDSVKHLNPIPALDYVHKRNAASKRQRSSVSDENRTTKSKIGPPVTQIHALSASISKSDRSSKPAAAKKAKVETWPTRCPLPLPLHPPNKAVSFPPPQSGKQYTKMEILLSFVRPSRVKSVLVRLNRSSRKIYFLSSDPCSTSC